jgi:hypothetical protein
MFICVIEVSNLQLRIRFFYLISELFWRCVIFLFFIFTTIYPSNIWLFNFQYSFFLLLLSPGFVIRVTQPVPLMEQELHTLPEHLRSPPVSGGSCCSIFGCLCRDLYFCPFWFVHCVVCTFFDLRYLQTLLTFIVLPRTN